MTALDRVALAVRVALALLVLACLGFAVLNLTTGQPERGAADLVGGATAAAVFTFGCWVTGAADRNRRPHPDYARIAELELEIYGRTFEHAGAPPPPPVFRRSIRLPTQPICEHEHVFGNCSYCRAEAQWYGRWWNGEPR